MIDEYDHAASVNAWLEHSTKSLSPKLRLEMFEASLCALLSCVRMTLGDVTIMAIMDRVLLNAAEKFPFFSAFTVEPNRGVQGQDLRERVAALDASELMDGIRFVLVEFLTVIGNLTAEVLTLELHAELSKSYRGGRVRAAVVGKAGLQEKGAPSKPTPTELTLPAPTLPENEHTAGEDEKS
jgi:hypothetical protein